MPQQLLDRPQVGPRVEEMRGERVPQRVDVEVAAARQLGIPARYVGGHFYRVDGVTAQDAGHAWVEAYVENLGWVGFDPTNGIGTTEAHVRVAIGLDYLGAAPVRGTRFGGSGETLQVAVHVDQAQRQAQN